MSASSPEAGALPRVGIVGASRRRQGLGPFVVRDLLDAGATVPCFLATREETRVAASEDLAKRFGIDCRGHLDFDAMLDEEELDAIAILSPSETHEGLLERTLAAGLHCLCDKPLVWGGRRLADRATHLARGFEERGLVLRENCQWPYTLPAFAALHPGVLDEPFRSFEMDMQPVNPGVGRLGDSLPHALSLVQALAPGEPRIEDLSISETGSLGGEILEIGFVHRTAGASPRVRVVLERSDAFPRHFSYAVNGRRAVRTVDDAYRLRFAHGERSVEVDDPLPLLVADFVAELAGRPARSRRDEIVARAALLEEIVEASTEGPGGT